MFNIGIRPVLFLDFRITQFVSHKDWISLQTHEICTSRADLLGGFLMALPCSCQLVQHTVVLLRTFALNPVQDVYFYWIVSFMKEHSYWLVCCAPGHRQFNKRREVH